jgi:NACHT domain
MRLIAILAGLCTLILLPLATNIASSNLPQSFQPYTWLAWPALAVLAPLSIVLAILDVKNNRLAGNPTIEIANRHRGQVLAKVRHAWIDDYLRHSLHELVRIELGLEEKPDAVSRPWDLIVQQPDKASRPLPPGQAMSITFDELGQALLILGAPGAGKTTLLLELARDLLDRADKDTVHPIPVVFHLASWAVSQEPLANWIVNELVERYYVPRRLAQTWIDTEQILPLLDGLDEVGLIYRTMCVEAINEFRHRHGLVPLAVCSREQKYHALSTPIRMSSAVLIKPISREQITSYLSQAGESLAGLRAVLRDDEVLWELLETPLVLSIVALTYQGRPAEDIHSTGSLEQRRIHLFETYTKAHV